MVMVGREGAKDPSESFVWLTYECDDPNRNRLGRLLEFVVHDHDVFAVFLRRGLVFAVSRHVCYASFGAASRGHHGQIRTKNFFGQHSLGLPT